MATQYEELATTPVTLDPGPTLFAGKYPRQDEGIIIATGQPALLKGAVLGQVLMGASSAVGAAGTNTGNGTMGSVVTSAGTKNGVYHLTAFAVATNAGKFTVEDPDGVQIGVATVGVAFSGGGLAFTIADGSTDFVAGDTFTITATIAAGSGKYVAYDPAGTNGSQNPAGILSADTLAATGDVSAVMYKTGCFNIALALDKNGDALSAAAKAALEAKNIYLRTVS